MIIDLQAEKKKRGTRVSVHPASKPGLVVFNVLNPATAIQLTWVLSQAEARQLGQMLIDAAGDPLDGPPQKEGA
jgi:hypothetical protein